jgi:hypothetical protein
MAFLADQEDVKAYKQLFSLLSTVPESSLPANFSGKVVDKIQARRNKADNRIHYLLIGFLTFLAIAGAVYIINEDVLSVLGSIMYKFKWLIVFSVAAFIGIQYMDGKLVKRKEGVLDS